MIITITRLKEALQEAFIQLNAKKGFLKENITRKIDWREDEEMVGERQRREPVGDVDKWHRLFKVWSILKW